MNNNIIIFCILVLLVSCKSNKQKNNLDNTTANGINILYDSLQLEPVKLDSIESSLLLQSRIHSDRIYLTDLRFGWVFEYDKNGKLLQRHLGQGKGPQEIGVNSIVTFCITPDYKFIFLSSSNDLWIYDHNFSKLQQFQFDRKEIKENGLETNPKIYTLMYMKLTMHAYNNNVYCSIWGNHPEFNIFTPDYFNKTRTIGEINIDSQCMNNVLGQFSPIAAQEKGIQQFPALSFDITPRGNFYIGYELDSLIYIYDQKFETQKSFGRAGKNITFDNHQKLNANNFNQEYLSERTNKSYYDQIKVIDDYVFRSYKKGSGLPYDGLQIYKDFTLIADVEVPKGFSIANKIDEYIYSNIITDETKEAIEMYRFKLN